MRIGSALTKKKQQPAPDYPCQDSPYPMDLGGAAYVGILVSSLCFIAQKYTENWVALGDMVPRPIYRLGDFKDSLKANGFEEVPTDFENYHYFRRV